MTIATLNLNADAHSRLFKLMRRHNTDEQGVIRLALATFETVSDHFALGESHEAALLFPDGTEQCLRLPEGK